MASRRPAQMSPRETQVLEAVGEHLSNAQIASRLHLSVRTVETHVSSLLRKLEAADRRELAALAASLATAPGDLAEHGPVRGRPSIWTPFIGRARELAAVRDALEASALVTVQGPGGVGKTRLAAVIADELAPGLPLGAFFVELMGVRRGFLEQAVAAVLGVSERPGQPLFDGISDRLRHGRSLLVLDNCEHLIDDVAAFLGTLLGRLSAVRVLATSRERLGVSGERVIPLAGLSLTPGSVGTEAGSEAVLLFLDRARALDPGFAADPAQVEELCSRLDGMPLAIELAAARTASLGVAGLSAGLGDRLRFLAGGRSLDRRHRSMRAVIDWSYQLLDDDEAAAFRRLGVFSGSFDLGAAGSVTALSQDQAADVVGRLVDKSLLVRRFWPAGSRWVMLETVRAYALEKSASAGEDGALRARHRQWAASAVAELEQRVERNESWRDDFDLIVDDLRAAVTSSDGRVASGGGTDSGDTGADDGVHRMTRGLGHLTYSRRFLAESRQHFLTAAAHAPDKAAAARDLRTAAEVAHVEDRGELTFRLRLEAAERAASAGDLGTEASVLAEAVSVGIRFPALFGADVPLEELQSLLARAERVAPAGDAEVAAQLAAARAWMETRAHELPGIAAFDEALRSARAADDPVLVSAALDAIMSAAAILGDFRMLQRLGRERWALLDRLPRHDPRAGRESHDLLHMTVENSLGTGDLPTALDAASRFDDDELVASTRYMAASKPMVALALSGRFDEAALAAERTREAWEDAGCPPARWMAPSVYAAGLAAGLQGRVERSEQWRRYAVEKLAGVQSRAVFIQLRGIQVFTDARLALHAGDLDAAVQAVRDIPTGADAWSRQRHWYFDAYPWAVAAEVAVLAGLPDVDARIGAAEAAAEQNDWAAACLARVRWRVDADPVAADASVAGWERIGARFERAATLLLIDGREAEGRAELQALGCPLPPRW